MKNVSKNSSYIVGETKAEASETEPSQRRYFRHEFLLEFNKNVLLLLSIVGVGFLFAYFERNFYLRYNAINVMVLY